MLEYDEFDRAYGSGYGGMWLRDRQDAEYLKRLIQAARNICERLGSGDGEYSHQEYGDGDISSFRVRKWLYQDEKILIKTAYGSGLYEKECIVKIALSSPLTPVFFYKNNYLYVYRQGQWEDYLLSSLQRRGFSGRSVSGPARPDPFSPVEDSEMFDAENSSPSERTSIPKFQVPTFVVPRR